MKKRKIARYKIYYGVIYLMSYLYATKKNCFFLQNCDGIVENSVRLLHPFNEGIVHQ